MAKTVGLPLGIAAKLILNGSVNLKGLHIPISKEIYEPVLKELEEYGIKFITS
jgi:saccharopine dehydrogenase (NADP+, L-glutamate forming)